MSYLYLRFVIRVWTALMTGNAVWKDKKLNIRKNVLMSSWKIYIYLFISIGYGRQFSTVVSMLTIKCRACVVFLISSRSDIVPGFKGTLVPERNMDRFFLQTSTLNSSLYNKISEVVQWFTKSTLKSIHSHSKNKTFICHHFVVKL